MADNEVNKTWFLFNDQIGAGGFGKVHSALLVKARHWLAVKEISKEYMLSHSVGSTMPMNELAALKRLDHPFIISLHFAFHDKQFCYLVFDLKTGGDLRHHMDKRHLFSEKDVAFYVACLGSALAHIHSKYVIHRDVKPENVILDHRGYPYLTDFGIAHVQTMAPGSDQEKLVSQLSSGTKQYLAPEVFTNLHWHGPESDFWSLGVLAHELLFGKRPFVKHCPAQFIGFLQTLTPPHFRDYDNLRFRGPPPPPLLIASGPGSAPSAASGIPRFVGNNSSPYASVDAEGKENDFILPQFSRGMKIALPRSSILPSEEVAAFIEARAREPLIPTVPPLHPHHLHPRSIPDKNPTISQDVHHPGMCPKVSPVISPALFPRPSPAIFDTAPLVRPSDSRTPPTPPPAPAPKKTRDAMPKHQLGIPFRALEMPPNLRVNIPEFSPKLGAALSPAAIDMLQGLLEVRPGVRLGNQRSPGMFYSHAWLVMHGITNPHILYNGVFRPDFSPAKRQFIRPLDQFMEVDEVMGLRTLSTETKRNPLGLEAVGLLGRESAFSEFNFVSRNYMSLVTQQQRCPAR